MITLINIKLRQAFMQRADIEQTFADLTAIREYINSFRYPINAVPFNVFERNGNYARLSEPENYNYISSALAYIYGNLYTTEELDLITVFILTKVHDSMIISDNLLVKVRACLNKTYTKDEMVYFQEELKFRYLMHLITDKNSSATEINTIMTELEAIESAHNSFQIDQRI